jgi:lysozyme family protein
MSQGNFDACCAVTLDFEGGNDDDPHDPGGRTSRGILQREWNKYRTTHPGRPADVFKAPQADVVAIYRDQYWAPVSGELWPRGVDLVVYDAGVNSGIGKALAWSRVMLSVGAATPSLREMAVLCQRRVAESASIAPELIRKFCARRMSFLQALGTWRYFGKGWTDRVTKIEAIARKWAISAAGMAPEAVQADLKTQARTAGAKSKAAGGSATAAPAAPAGASWNLAHESWADIAILTGIVLLALVVIAWLVHKWYVHSKRSVAFAQVSADVVPK